MDKNKIKEHILILTEVLITSVLMFVLRMVSELIVDTGETWKSIAIWAVLFGITWPIVRRYLVKKNILEDNYKQKE